MPPPSPAPLPGRSYYGFVAYTLASAAMPGYLAWALLPRPWLAALGLSYLPHPLWAVMLPLLLLGALLLLVGVVYPLANWRLTLRPADMRNFTDSHALSRQHYSAAGTANTSVPPVYDVPVWAVCGRLYAGDGV